MIVNHNLNKEKKVTAQGGLLIYSNPKIPTPKIHGKLEIFQRW